MKNNLLKKLVPVIVGMMAVSTLAGCGESKAAVEERGESYWTDLAVKPEAPVNNTEKVLRVLDGWPKPPLFQGNVFASGGVGGLVEKTVFEGLFQFVRSTDEVEFRMAESYEQEGNKVTVKIRKDIKWHDGTPFTSKDLGAYYTLNNGTEITRYLDSIETPDEYTIVFNWIDESPNDTIKKYYIARERQGVIPYHIFKEYVDKADSLLKKATKAKDGEEKSAYQLNITPELRAELDENWRNFTAFTIPAPIGTGAYKFDKVTETQINLSKYPEYWDASNINFEKIEGYQVPDSAAQLAMLENGKVDLMGGTPPVDIIDTMLKKNPDLVHYKMDDPASFGVFFNTREEQLSKKEVRQALIYATDRKPIREFANYYGVDYEYAQLGLSPSVLDKYVDKDVIDNMTKYNVDLEKAENLLNGIGWTKGTDNKWVDENGKAVDFMIGAPAGDQEKVNYCQAVADQWTLFGIPTKVQLQDSSIYWSAAPKGEYDMCVDYVDISWNWLDPHGSLQQSIWGMKNLAGLPADETTNKMLVEIPLRDGTTINYEDAVEKLLMIEDGAERNALISDIVSYLNESAYVMPMYQNITGVWVNTKTIGGDLPSADKITSSGRNMLIPEEQEERSKLAKLNMGFSDGLFIRSGKYFPR